jgi:hypothetical protein
MGLKAMKDGLYWISRGEQFRTERPIYSFEVHFQLPSGEFVKTFNTCEVSGTGDLFLS